MPFAIKLKIGVPGEKEPIEAECNHFSHNSDRKVISLYKSDTLTTRGLIGVYNYKYFTVLTDNRR